MKAWIVEDVKAYEGGLAVVFAESRGKAHALAMNTEACEDADWNDVHVKRLPVMDKMYKPGKVEMNWNCPEDRIALVKECGWYCNNDYVDRETDCAACPAADYCVNYQDWKEDPNEIY